MIKPLVALLIFLLPASMAPDEGQWLPQQFLDQDWKELKARGLTLTKDQFWHPEKGGVLSAAVQINGCSATLVSADGLVVTNHHCAFGAIQAQSSVEKNYVKDGFVALNREDEIQATGTQLRIVRNIEDVTKKIHAASKDAKSDLERLELVEKAKAQLIKEGEAANEDTECSIASFFNGRMYHLYQRTLIRDVRLVYAPPRSVGEFGGEVDNWEWPRHTGDFTFLRAYVGPDGKPAAYSKNNVPLKPKHWIKVSGQGVAAGDLVMITGYPGRTERYLSSTAVNSRQFQMYPLRYRFFTKLIDAINAHTEGNPKLKLRYSSNVKSFANVQKNALGMIKGLARNKVVARKLTEEAAFAKWLSEKDDRKAKYGDVLKEMLAADNEEAAVMQRETLLNAVIRNTALLSAFSELATAMEDKELNEAGRKQMARRLGNQRLTQRFDWLEKPLLAFLIDELQKLPKDQQLPGQSDVIGGLSGEEWVASWVATTELMDAKKRSGLVTATEASDDSMVRLGKIMAPELRSISQRRQLRLARALVLGAQWIGAQQAWRGKTFYPDANSTLRVSAATVKGYMPKDGVFYTPKTTLKGVVSKTTGKEPFDAPEALLKAAASDDKGRFVDPELADVPVCFLSDGDTTGGNSGSGVINGRGELVGLNFDRVFENVAGDYGWNADRSRNISVDIRYVLWQIEKVRPAPKLLKELGF